MKPGEAKHFRDRLMGEERILLAVSWNVGTLVLKKKKKKGYLVRHKNFIGICEEAYQIGGCQGS